MIISGFFYKELNRDYYNGVADFIINSSDAQIYCKGMISPIKNNTPLELIGHYQNNVFYFEEYHILEKDTMVVSFLLSLNLKKFTEEDAWFFATFFNNGLFHTIRQTNFANHFTELLPKEYRKVGKEIFSKIKIFLLDEELFQYVIEHGGHYENCLLLTKKYKQDALTKLKHFPYTIGQYCGLSFQICDMIASENNKTTNSSDRIDGVIALCFDCMKKSGNTYYTKQQFLNKADKILSKCILGTIPHEFLMARIILDKKYTIDTEDRITTAEIDFIENSIAQNIKRIAANPQKLPFDANKISAIETLCDIQLGDSQKKSFEMLRKNGIKILKGGPGSGKTTTVNVLISYIETIYNDKELILCAPTGCAAQNLANKTGKPAQTIHKTLNYKPFGDSLGITKKMNADIYIVDEASMLDEELLYLFLNAVPTNSMVIFIGDSDQLPSVGYGNVLQDMMNSPYVEIYELDGTYRQDVNSSIVTNAQKINHKETDLLLEEDDFTVFDVETAEEAEDLGIEMLKNVKDCMCLCPNKKNTGGTQAMNDRYRPNANNQKKTYHSHEFFLHDKIIMTHNNYVGGYHNGDFGEIVDIDDLGIEIKLEFDTIYISNAMLKDVLPAYAITVHKSQGSEHDDVVILLTKRALTFADKRILYTAVTRAKKKVTIITEGDTLYQLIQKDPPKRQTRLGELL
jgi:exodeoxyribonuclease V alpha subunit